MTSVPGIEITDRHEVEIDSMLTKRSRRDFGGIHQTIEVTALPIMSRRWKHWEITAETNNAAAFLIYRDDRLPLRARSHRIGKFQKLRRCEIVSGEKDYTT